MRRMLTIVGVLCILSSITMAQRHEVGVGVGVSNFMGDLGRMESEGNWYFNNLQASLTKPAFKTFYRFNISTRFAVNTSLNIGFFAGDDRLAQYDKISDDNWYRNYRNLNFKSVALELSSTVEFNILHYSPGNMKDRFTPYIFGGIAMLFHNPKGKINGEWVRLQPLGTEGQGMPGYGKKYSLIQPTIPLGLGMKYNITRYLTLAFEFGHRVTFSDYLDDVSGLYPEKDAIFNNYSAERADLIYSLSRRSTELDPDGEYGYITEGGEYRGNPKANDSYLFSMISLSYNISRAADGDYLSRKKTNPLGRKSRNLKRYKKAF